MLVIPSGTSSPDLTNWATAGVVPKSKSMRPPRRSTIAGLVPL